MTDHTHKPEQEGAEVSSIEFKETFKTSNSVSQNLLPICILLAAIIIAGSVFYNTKLIIKAFSGKTGQTQNTGNAGTDNQQAANQNNPAKAPSQANINLKADVPYLGNKDAKVTVVEYADYQCPFCEKFYTSVMSELKTKYIDTNKIKFVFQDFAFLGADSATAAEATHCAADQGKFWQYHDYLFKNQGQENGGWAAASHQKEFAKTLGLNTGQFNQCMDSHKYSQEVQDETNAGKSYGVSGTPSVFVNGKIIVGAQPAANFEQAIEAALQ